MAEPVSGAAPSPTIKDEPCVDLEYSIDIGRLKTEEEVLSLLYEEHEVTNEIVIGPTEIRLPVREIGANKTFDFIETRYKKVRSNKNQIQYLCQYMSQNRVLARSTPCTLNRAEGFDKQWEDLTAALNKLGQHRSVKQWQVCWRDQKSKHRMKKRTRIEIKKTGDHKDVPVTSDNRVLTMKTIGDETAADADLILLTEVTDPLAMEPSAAPSTSAPPALSQSKAMRKSRELLRRKARPLDHFLKSQRKQNSLLQSLIQEVKRGNDIKQEQNNFLRIIVNKFGGDEKNQSDQN